MVFNTASPYTIPEVLHDHSNTQLLESTIYHIIHKAFHMSGKCCYPILQPTLQMSQALKKLFSFPCVSSVAKGQRDTNFSSGQFVVAKWVFYYEQFFKDPKSLQIPLGQWPWQTRAGTWTKLGPPFAKRGRLLPKGCSGGQSEPETAKIRKPFLKVTA